VSDFASAAMGRVLMAGMRIQGITPPTINVSSKLNGAKIPLDYKRILLETAVAQKGLGVLALLGEGLHQFAQVPTHLALCTASSPFEMIKRWQKIERYIHSRHRIQVSEQAEQSLALQHYSIASYPTPLLAESLVVLGVLLALCEATGAIGLTAAINDCEVYPRYDESVLQNFSYSAIKTNSELTKTQLAICQIRWNKYEAKTYPQTQKLTRPNLPALATQVVEHLSNAVIEPVKIEQVAQKLNCSTRSLQRHLQELGFTFSGLQATARAQQAGHFLMQSNTAVSEIGFLCGYSDQAHFTREFKRATGITPSKYRESFASA
jgi:AraC-like DNA-binding protein